MITWYDPKDVANLRDLGGTDFNIINQDLCDYYFDCEDRHWCQERVSNVDADELHECVRVIKSPNQINASFHIWYSLCFDPFIQLHGDNIYNK